MTWTAELASITKAEFNILPVVRFTNGAETFTRTFTANDITADRLAALVKAQLTLLDQRDAAFATLLPGPIGAPPADDPAEVLAKAFFVLLYELNALLAQVAKGLLAVSDKSVTDKQAEVKAAFLSEYAKDPRYR